MNDYELEVHICQECLEVFLHKNDLDSHDRHTRHKAGVNVKVNPVTEIEDKKFLLFTLVE